jgi:hypothetical protein
LVDKILVLPANATSTDTFGTPRPIRPFFKMDQRELTSRVSALTKAINDKEPAANVITIMETLKRDVNATEELLRVCG